MAEWTGQLSPEASHLPQGGWVGIWTTLLLLLVILIRTSLVDPDSVGSVINWPPGSGSVILLLRIWFRIQIQILTIYQRLIEMLHFIAFNDLLPGWQHIFDNDHKNVQVGSRSGAESVINWPPGSGSVIQDYGTKNPDPKINNYESTTLMRTVTNTIKNIFSLPERMMIPI